MDAALIKNLDTAELCTAVDHLLAAATTAWGGWLRNDPGRTAARARAETPHDGPGATSASVHRRFRTVRVSR